MDSAHSRSSAVERLARFPWLIVWVGLGLCCSFSLWFGIAGLVYPYQLDYGEGIVLWFTQQLAQGHSIYKGLTGLPYASSNYPPLAILLAALLMPIFGDGYAAGRLLNLSSALLVAALIYRIVTVETQDRRGGALAAFFFFGSSYIFHWVALFRVDLLGLGFTFAGLYAVWKAGREAPGTRGQRIYLLLATLMFLLALYTKQTLFAAPAAAFFALWGSNRRLAMIFGFALAVVGGGVYLAMDYFTAGALTFGLLTSNATVFMPEQLIKLLANFVETFPVLLVLAFFELVQRVRRKNTSVLDWYAVTSFAALAMAGRTGAWENYFFEALASTCVLAGIALASWLPARPRFASEFRPVGRPALGFALSLLLLAQLAFMWPDPLVAVDLMAKDFPANQALNALLRDTRGIVLSEDMGALATSGKGVAYYTFQYSSLARSGRWDQLWELDGLRDGLFPLVILEHGTRQDVDHYRRFTREFVSALDRYYGRVQAIGKYEIYAPAPLAHLQAASFGESIAMVGWTVTPRSFQPAVVQVTIVWQAQRVIDQRYTAFVHLVNAQSAKVTQDDHEPYYGDYYPTTRWATGEMVRDVYVLQVPAGSPPGKYAIRAGWYDSDSKDRLTVPGSADDSVELMTLVVPPSE